MRFGVLGPLAVWTSGGEQVAVPEPKVRALLADLLLHEGRVVAADRLVEDLWGAQLPGNPANTLQTKISQLRRTLERAEPGAGTLLVHRAPGYLLAAGPGELDLSRFAELTASAREANDPRVRAELGTAALALWRGPALTDFAGEPFAVAAAQRLAQDRIAVSEESATARLELGEHAELCAELAALLAEHPLRERLRGLYMRALYRSGRQTEALEQYAELRARLQGELGLEPGPELTELHQAILRQDPELVIPVRRGTLPSPLTALIGRTSDFDAGAALLRTARLVTFTGPGGVGKTRLAIAVAGRSAAADGAWFIELAGLERTAPCPEEAVLDALAAVLGIRAGSPAELADALRGKALYTKDMLLVIDNCEQLLDPVAAVLNPLLQACPELRVLATSRQPLGIAGESVYPVEPLPAADAALLFTERARERAVGTELDPGTVAEICRRLDGIPLALELAATRVRGLGLVPLLDRLADRFTVLAAGDRGVPRRQRTLRATLDWSWELLEERERTVLRRVCVHVDGFGPDAAERLCADPELPAETVLEVLARLVDHSLLVRTGSGRYRLLESVTAYGLERLAEAGERERLLDAHVRHYLELAERAGPGLRGPRQREWLEVLDAESGNLRAAVDTTLGTAADTALRLVTALSWYWFLRGRFGFAIAALDAALAVGGAPGLVASASAWRTGFRMLAGTVSTGTGPTGTEPDVRAADPLARWFLGYAAATLGDWSGAVHTESALGEFEESGDTWGIAAARCDRAGLALAEGRLAEAGADGRISAGYFAELGERWGQVQAQFVLGVLAAVAGEYERAARIHRTSLGHAEELGLWPEVSYQLSWLGRTALLAGEPEDARRLHERAARLAAEHGFTAGEMYAITGLALGARRAGDLDTAQRQLNTLHDWHRDSGAESPLVLAELGFLAEQRADPATARKHHRRALGIAGDNSDPRAIALATEGLAGVAVLDGDHAEAARLLGEAAARRRSVGAPLPPGERGDVERIGTAAKATLGARRFAAEFAKGERL
ncbi:BTAD domain-containing putative transcriptional regulator [Sciscionella marina]|uniref:BTAD domain-containing putative transcriptional regulator n=1 Tax=Sciscionella marina TaxID=508770 RepID=UPI0003A9B522